MKKEKLYKCLVEGYTYCEKGKIYPKSSIIETFILERPHEWEEVTLENYSKIAPDLKAYKFITKNDLRQNLSKTLKLEEKTIIFSTYNPNPKHWEEIKPDNLLEIEEKDDTEFDGYKLKKEFEYLTPVIKILLQQLGRVVNSASPILNTNTRHIDILKKAKVLDIWYGKYQKPKLPTICGIKGETVYDLTKTAKYGNIKLKVSQLNDLLNNPIKVQYFQITKSFFLSRDSIRKIIKYLESN